MRGGTGRYFLGGNLKVSGAHMYVYMSSLWTFAAGYLQPFAVFKYMLINKSVPGQNVWGVYHTSKSYDPRLPYISHARVARIESFSHHLQTKRNARTICASESV